MELEAGCVVWSIRRLRRYPFSLFFIIYTDHECLQQISKMGENEPRIQRWMEFLSAYNDRLSYRRGRENANDDFLSRLPLPADILGSSALTEPDGLGLYLIRACGYITPSCPIPVVGLGGMVPSLYPTPGTDLNGFVPSPIPVLGGLPLTKDDFCIHRTPMPTMHMTGATTRSFAAVPTKKSCLVYAINDQHDTSRSNCPRRTQSRTAILAGNTPLRPDTRTAAHSGFAASADPGPPPTASFRSSPPPRLARLGHDPTRSSCLALPDSGPQPPVGPLAARNAPRPANHFLG